MTGLLECENIGIINLDYELRDNPTILHTGTTTMFIQMLDDLGQYYPVMIWQGLS